MKPLGLGIIGLHHQHPRWYHPLWAHLPEYEPRVIADADEAFLASETTHFGLDAVADYRAVLDRNDVDVVIVWLPHSQMPEAVADAAAAGKHVIVEKPCGADVAGVRRIVETARQHPSIKISAPYCWRTHPVSDEIRRAVDDGLLGRITAGSVRLNAGGAHRYVRDNATWMLRAAEGGGPMWNLGVHWIDYLRWITGRRVVRVSGTRTEPHGEPTRDIEDTAQGLLEFDDGATFTVEASYSIPASYPGSRDIFIALRGTLGDAVWAPAWQGFTDKLLLVSEHESVGDDRCRTLEITSQDIPGYCGEMAWRWLKDFAAAIHEDRPPIVPPDDLLGAVQVADAFYRSCRTGRAEAVQT